MATYKVLQDIEAEDKLLGPLTLRQFIYAFISAGCLYVSFLLLTKGAAYMLILFLPVAGMSGFFAWPWRGDQPTEIWALAKIRFLVKPRRRIWDQSGAKELVSITVPKKVETNYTNGLSETEVKSRLHALADTIDSRGWAIKNVGLNAFGQQPLVMSEPSSDRLISPQDFPQEVPATDIQPSDDMLDEQNNVAHQFDTMITASNKAHRQKIMQQLQGALRPQAVPVVSSTVPPPRPQPQAPAPAAPASRPQQLQQPPNDYWFMNQPTPGSDNSQSSSGPAPGAVTFNAQVVSPGLPATPPPVAATPSADEEALVQQLEAQEKADHISYSHLHTIQPLSAQKPMPKPLQPKVTQPSDAAIINLASNDDLNVATIAREAHKQRPEPPQDEVIISLH